MGGRCQFGLFFHFWPNCPMFELQVCNMAHDSEPDDGPLLKYMTQGPSCVGFKKDVFD